MSLGSLVFSLQANTAQFTSAISRASQAAAAGARRMQSSFADVAKGQIVADLAMRALDASVARLARSFESAGDAIDAEQSFGTVAEKFYAMRHAVESAGDAFDPMKNILGKLQQNLAETGSESQAMGKVLKELGLDLAELKKSDPVDALRMVGTALQEITDPAVRAAVGTEVLGKGYRDAANSLNAFVEAEDHGSGVTQEMLKSIDDLTDAVGGSSAQMDNAATIVAGTLAPQLLELAKVFSLTGSDAQSTATSFAQSLAPAITFVSRLANGMVYGFKEVALGLAALGKISSALVRGQWGEVSELHDAWKSQSTSLQNQFTLNDRAIAGAAQRAAVAARQARGDFSDIADAIKRKAAEEDYAERKRETARTSALKSKQEHARFDRLLAKPDKAATEQPDKIAEAFARMREEIAKAKMSYVDFETFKFSQLKDVTPDQVAKFRLVVEEAEATRAIKTFSDKLEDMRLEAEALGKDEVSAGVIKLKAELEKANVPADKINEAVAELHKLLSQKAEFAFAKDLEAMQADIEKIGKTAQEQAEIDIRLRYKDDPNAAEHIRKALGKNTEKYAAETREQIEDMRRKLQSEAAALGATPLTQYLQELKEVQRLNPQVTDDIIADLGRQKQANLDMLATYERGQDVVNTLSDTVVDGLSAMANGTMTAKEAFKSLTNAVGNLILKYMVLKPLEDALKGTSGGGSSGWGGGLIGAGLDYVFGSGKALGGGVSASAMHQVVEQGPELFQSRGRTYLMTGDQGGNIVPVDASAGGGVGGGVNVTQHITIDARGADAGVEQRIRDAMKQAKEETLVEVQLRTRRGGSFMQNLRGG
jgi:head-tail adaptor